MVIVKQILQRKGSQVFSTGPDSTVYEALEMMASKDIGALLVMKADKLVGIFSERDYARKLILHGKTSQDTLVHEVMTETIYAVSPETKIEECMALMTDQHIRHLPVMDGKQVVGVISIGDVLKEMISEQGFHIKQLENYIAGSR